MLGSLYSHTYAEQTDNDRNSQRRVNALVCACAYTNHQARFHAVRVQVALRLSR